MFLTDGCSSARIIQGHILSFHFMSLLIFEYITVIKKCWSAPQQLVRPKLDGWCSGGSIQSANIVLSQMYFVFANGSAAFVLQLTARVRSVPLPASQKVLPVIVANCAVQMDDFVEIIGKISTEIEYSYFILVTLREGVARQSGFLSAGCDICRQWPSSDTVADSISGPDSSTIQFFSQIMECWHAGTCKLAQHEHTSANKVLHLLLFAHNHFLLCLHASDFSISLNPFSVVPLNLHLPLSASEASSLPARVCLLSRWLPNDLLTMSGLFFKREASQLSQKVFIWIFSLYDFGVNFVKSCAQWSESVMCTDVLCLCFLQLTCSFLFWNSSSLFSKWKGMY